MLVWNRATGLLLSRLLVVLTLKRSAHQILSIGPYLVGDLVDELLANATQILEAGHDDKALEAMERSPRRLNIDNGQVPEVDDHT